MLGLGGIASQSHVDAFQGIAPIFRRRGIELDWVLYSGYDALVDAFVSREIDMAWNGPLSYVKIRRQVDEPCRVIAMRDVGINFVTGFITRQDSDITTVEDLIGRRFAFGRRGSVQTGLLAHYFLKQSGINPRSDLAQFTFYDERDAGAVSLGTLDAMNRKGALPADSVRVLWSSPGYSHCCFTAQGDMNGTVSDEVEQAFVSIDDSDAVGRTVLKAEGCRSIVPGISEGWDLIEAAALEEGLL
jgi:ABC-type phosphate/phosphonate transport system substrate-binding protein